MKASLRTLTEAEWRAEGRALFGADTSAWRFVCPACGHVASVRDWQTAGAPDGAIAFSCVGRYTGARRDIFDKGPGPCNYAGGGLFLLNPIVVVHSRGESRYFDFARKETT